MTCPNCGAVDQLGAECGVCGIVFARWRPRPEPAATLATPQRERRGMQLFGVPPYRTFVPILSILLFFGLLWVYSRLGRDRTTELQQLTREQRQFGPSNRPHITDDQIIELIEQCRYFQEPIVVKIPRSVQPGTMGWVDKRVILALNMELIELDPPFNASEAARYLPNPANPGPLSEIRRGRNPQGIPMSEMTEGYVIDVGHRKIESIEIVQRARDFININYRWTVEDPRLLYFAPDSSELRGGARIQRTGSGWKAHVWRNTPGSSVTVCDQQ